MNNVLNFKYGGSNSAFARAARFYGGLQVGQASGRHILIDDNDMAQWDNFLQ